MSLESLAYSTARLYKTAIGWKCKLQGEIDVTDNYVVAKILVGLQKSATSNRARLPITLDMLKQIIPKVPLTCFNLYESSLFSAAFALAFHGFFRIGEITITRSEYENRVVSASDLTIDPFKSYMTVVIRGSKTDQEKKGQAIRIPRTYTNVCPVEAVLQYMQRRPPVNGPLLCHLDGKPLSRAQFSAVLKRILAMLGVNYKLFSTHSFRIGAATSAAMYGIDTRRIMSAGRWRSDAYKKYIRTDSVIEMPVFS